MKICSEGMDLSWQVSQVCNVELRTLFNEGIHRIPKDADAQTKAVDTAYKEFARKLCSTRINESLDTQKQLMATSTGKATLSGHTVITACKLKEYSIKKVITGCFSFSILFLLRGMG